MIIAGCGTSYNAGLYGEIIMNELGCFKFVKAMMASEITEKDFPKKNGGFLSIS